MATETTAHGKFVDNLKSRAQGFIMYYLTSKNWRTQNSVTMTKIQPGAIYFVDAKFFSPALIKNYRATLSDTERCFKVIKVELLGLIAGSWSYECKVVGIADKLRLSSKSLVNVNATASHQGPNITATVHCHSGSAGDTEESESDENEVFEDDAVDASAHEVSIVKAKDWRLVADFEDPLASQHPKCII
jgi:hypothetical protein